MARDAAQTFALSNQFVPSHWICFSVGSSPALRTGQLDSVSDGSQSDAAFNRARIEALEAENATLTAQRDEAEDRYQRECLGLNNEGDPIGGDPPMGWKPRAQNAEQRLSNSRSVHDDLMDALREGRRAIGEHHAPGDCYATGPLTGDAYRDLIECPACSFIARHDAALASHDKRKEGRP